MVSALWAFDLSVFFETLTFLPISVFSNWEPFLKNWNFADPKFISRTITTFSLLGYYQHLHVVYWKPWILLFLTEKTFDRILVLVEKGVEVLFHVVFICSCSKWTRPSVVTTNRLTPFFALKVVLGVPTHGGWSKESYFCPRSSENNPFGEGFLLPNLLLNLLVTKEVHSTRGV